MEVPSRCILNDAAEQEEGKELICTVNSSIRNINITFKLRLNVILQVVQGPRFKAQSEAMTLLWN